ELHPGELLAQHTAGQAHHHLAVAARVLLRPEQVAAVGLHLGRARDEHREVAVGQVLVVRQFGARSMWYLASSLPMLRDPECSTTHTAPSSSRHTSRKWLPPPRVPIW